MEIVLAREYTHCLFWYHGVMAGVMLVLTDEQFG
jgi:hypothetical protein